jgi:hypothetical protein
VRITWAHSVAIYPLLIGNVGEFADRGGSGDPDKRGLSRSHVVPDIARGLMHGPSSKEKLRPCLLG